MSQANDFYNAIDQHQVHKLAGSPLLWHVIQTLNIERLVDNHCPSSDKQRVSHGQAASEKPLWRQGTKHNRAKTLEKASWAKIPRMIHNSITNQAGKQRNRFSCTSHSSMTLFIEDDGIYCVIKGASIFANK